jgi:hypothetical protein
LNKQASPGIYPNINPDIRTSTIETPDFLGLRRRVLK